MVTKKPFVSQEICYINGNGKIKLCAVSAYIKYLLIIVEIENKFFQRCSTLRTPFELITDKLIISLDELLTSNSHKQINHPKCTILANDTIILDVIFQNYYQE